MSEKTIFKIVTNHIQERVSTIEFAKDYFDGYEYWFQIEVIAALQKAGISTSIKDKTEYDADIVIKHEGKKFGIEMRCYKASHGGDFIKSVMNDHKDADYYLLITEKVDRIDKYLDEAKSRGFKPMKKDVHQNWMILYGKNPQKISNE